MATAGPSCSIENHENHRCHTVACDRDEMIVRANTIAANLPVASPGEFLHYDSERSGETFEQSGNEGGLWDSLRQLLADFHRCVDVELPALLERIRVGTAVSAEFLVEDTDPYSSHASSRHCFDLRRCLRSIQELLIREDLLGLLDHDFDDSVQGQKEKHPNHGSRNLDASLLLRMFTSDLVKLATMTDLDGHGHGRGRGHGHNSDSISIDANTYSSINDDYSAKRGGGTCIPANHEDSIALEDPGIFEMYRSLAILAAERFPSTATLEDAQISRLLSRVLSLIEGKLWSMQRQVQMQQQYHYRHQGSTLSQCFVQDSECGLLQSLLSWLNREMTYERLHQVVKLFSDDYQHEVAGALRVSLEFWTLLTTAGPIGAPSWLPQRQPQSLPTSAKPSIDSKASGMKTRRNTNLFPELVLSLRIFIDALLETLQCVVIEESSGGGESSSSSSSNNNDNAASDSSSPTSLREWMLRSEQRASSDSSAFWNDSNNYNNNHDNRDNRVLLRLLDRYALELIEETLELLRPQPPNLKVRPKYRYGDAIDLGSNDEENGEGFASEKLDCKSNGSNPHGYQRTPATQNVQGERVQKALQYAAMTTNFFSIMEDNPSRRRSASTQSFGRDTQGTKVFAGLSRTLWRSLARFVFEEVDALGTSPESSSDRDHCNELDTDDNDDDDDDTDTERWQIVATDLLVRLTQIHVPGVVVNRKPLRHALNDGHHDETLIDGDRDIHTRLSEEEFSILGATILRMLGHPEDYWTPEHQTWVAGLLRVENQSHSSAYRDPAVNYAIGIDVAAKLRSILQTAILCNTYVPDALPFEQQRLVQSSLKDLLQKSHTSSILNESVTTTGSTRRQTIDNSSLSKKAELGTLNDPTRGEDDLLALLAEEDPWKAFWPVCH